MLKGLAITLGVALSIGLLGWFVKSLKDAQSEDMTKLLGIQQKLSVKVSPDIHLRDEHDQPVEFGQLFKGRPVVLMMLFYTCQSACITEFDEGLKTYRSLKSLTVGKDYDVVTVSINPKEDASLARAKRAEYLDLYNRPESEDGWHFLTGSYEEVQKLAKQVGFKYSYDPKTNRVVHPTGLIILTPTMRVSKYFMGTTYPARYFSDSLVAAAANEVGAVAEPVSVGCFSIDPSTGRTFVTAQNALRLTGSITVLAMVFGIWSLLRKEKSEGQAKVAESAGGVSRDAIPPKEEETSNE